MNLLDRAILAVAPAAGLKRIQARKVTEYINSGFSHSGASRVKKSLAGWDSSSRSPQEDVDYNLPLLRERSRDLYMSSPIATSAIKTNRANVIGCGLRLKSRIDGELLGLSQEAAEEWQRRTEREFALWAESKLCDAQGLNNFYDLQQLALMSWLMNGDAFCVIQQGERRKSMPYELRLHMVEADRISTPGDLADGSEQIGTAKNGNRIYSGVEINKGGAVEAYYICSSYPDSELGADQKKWQRIELYGKETEERNVLHIMETERPGQYRGVPYLAPVIEQLKQISRYTEVELMAAVVNSLFTVLLKNVPNPSDRATGESIEEDQRTDDDNPYSYELGSGAVLQLPDGQEPVFADPNHPVSGFDAFVRSIAMQVGAALEIPFEMLFKNFQASYSASRAAFQEAWKIFRMRRTWFAGDFCQPVYELWLSEAVALGRVSAPGFFADPLIRKAWCGAEWNGPATGQIDPKKEAEAAELRVRNGFSTRAREAMELNGSSFAENVRQLKGENDLLRQAGILEGGNKDAVLGNQE